MIIYINRYVIYEIMYKKKRKITSNIINLIIILLLSKYVVIN